MICDKCKQPLPPTMEQRLCEAINALGCEYRASYEYPGHVQVYPQPGTNGADSVDALRWAWGFEKDELLGNDCHVQRDTETIIIGGMGITTLAKGVVDLMRIHALKRCSYLNDLCERMARHLEDVNPDRDRLINEWRQR